MNANRTELVRSGLDHLNPSNWIAPARSRVLCEHDRSANRTKNDVGGVTQSILGVSLSCVHVLEMAAGWTDAEVFKLIELWKEEGIQEQLEGSKRNKHVYEKLATQLTKAGFKKTGEQCRCKVKKLRQDYKKIKDNNGLTGRGRGKWRFYDAIDEVLGNRPATRPPVVIDTTEDQPDPDPLDESLALSNREEISDDEETSPTVSCPDGNGRMSTSPAVLGPDGNGSTSDSNEVKPKRSRKRKRGKAEQLEDVLSKVMKTMTDGMRETDKLFIELEEKRLAQEAQQRREERQFQLQLAQLFAGQPSTSSFGYSGYPPHYYSSQPLPQPQPMSQPQQQYYPDDNRE